MRSTTKTACSPSMLKGRSGAWSPWTVPATASCSATGNTPISTYLRYLFLFTFPTPTLVISLPISLPSFSYSFDPSLIPFNPSLYLHFLFTSSFVSLLILSLFSLDLQFLPLIYMLSSSSSTLALRYQHSFWHPFPLLFRTNVLCAQDQIVPRTSHPCSWLRRPPQERTFRSVLTGSFVVWSSGPNIFTFYLLFPVPSYPIL